tara:strand:+ start:1045 stop:1806 length:762 start_codon:yes stop_codon:yes gene_type:complete
MGFFNIIKLDAISSTNDYLKVMRKSKKTNDMDLVWAIKQTSGKGQRENKWFSEYNKSLTFSIYKNFNDYSNFYPFLISVVISISIVKCLEELKVPNVSIKWPNDILSCNKKIGGILIENFFSNGKLVDSVIGIGLNINQKSFKNLPNASSLKIETGENWDIQYILENLLVYIKKGFKDLEDIDEKKLIDLYQTKLWKFKEKAIFNSKNSNFEAKIFKVNLNGELVLKIKGKEMTCDNREIKILYDYIPNSTSN